MLLGTHNLFLLFLLLLIVLVLVLVITRCHEKVILWRGYRDQLNLKINNRNTKFYTLRTYIWSQLNNYFE